MGSMDRVDAQVIMAEVLGVNRAWIAANPMRILTESEDAKIDMLATQRALGQPIAYLLRRREFYGRDFTVNADVLIPRPETETLIEASLPRLGPRASCLDLGTGSGAIALAIKRLSPAARVTATDASAAALAVARRNAEHNGVAIEIVEGSWWAAVEARRFDIAVANPPYVAAGDPHLAELRHEPRAALTPGGDGLGALRTIAAGAPDHLFAGGWLIVEHGFDQGASVRDLLAEAGLVAIETRCDLAGLERATAGRLTSTA